MYNIELIILYRLANMSKIVKKREKSRVNAKKIK